MRVGPFRCLIGFDSCMHVSLWQGSSDDWVHVCDHAIMERPKETSLLTYPNQLTVRIVAAIVRVQLHSDVDEVSWIVVQWRLCNVTWELGGQVRASPRVVRRFSSSIP
jgi:hypothetical protein